MKWALALCLCLGCATVGAQDSARRALLERASFDLACSRVELRVTRVVDDRVLVDVASGVPVTRGGYQVRGCGNDALYYVDCSGDSQAPKCMAQQTTDLKTAFPDVAQ